MSDLKIVMPPHKKSARAVHDSELEVTKLQARDMQLFLETYSFRGKGGLALHHAQVERDDPKNFFVLKRSVVGAKDNEIVLIVNPKILSKEDGTRVAVKEGCMSFPFRPDTRINRYQKIRVEWYTIDHNEDDGNILVRHEEDAVGIIAQIFQHENLHAHAQHIYQ